MLAQARETVPGPGVLPGGPAFEAKFDGYRALLFTPVDPSGPVLLQSRRGSLIQRHFPDLVTAAKQLPHGLVLDGELLTEPYERRRAILLDLFTKHGLTPPWTLCPMTTDPAFVQEWLSSWTKVQGVEGIVIKGLGQRVCERCPRLVQGPPTPHHRSHHRRHHRHTGAPAAARPGPLRHPGPAARGRAHHAAEDRRRPPARRLPHPGRFRPSAAPTPPSLGVRGVTRCASYGCAWTSRWPMSRPSDKARHSQLDERGRAAHRSGDRASRWQCHEQERAGHSAVPRATTAPRWQVSAHQVARRVSTCFSSAGKGAVRFLRVGPIRARLGRLSVIAS
jgi:hypothetical protein